MNVRKYVANKEGRIKIEELELENIQLKKRVRILEHDYTLARKNLDKHDKSASLLINRLESAIEEYYEE